MIGAFVFDQVIFFQFTADLAKDYLPGVDVFDNPSLSQTTAVPESFAAFSSIPVPTYGASVCSSGIACRCMLAPSGRGLRRHARGRGCRRSKRKRFASARRRSNRLFLSAPQRYRRQETATTTSSIISFSRSPGYSPGRYDTVLPYRRSDKLFHRLSTDSFSLFALL